MAVSSSLLQRDDFPDDEIESDSVSADISRHSRIPNRVLKERTSNNDGVNRPVRVVKQQKQPLPCTVENRDREPPTAAESSKNEKFKFKITKLWKPKSVRHKRIDTENDETINLPPGCRVETVDASSTPVLIACFGQLEDLLQFNLCTETIPWADLRQRRKRQQITVKVLATTVPIMEEHLHLENTHDSRGESHGDYRSHTKQDACFVGTVYKRETQENEPNAVSRGTLVTSIQRCSPRTQFVNIDAQSLIVLSDKYDPGEAASIASTHLPAFAALHHGSPNRVGRFSPSALQGKMVFITGGDRPDAIAAAKLARLGGADGVYFASSRKHVQESMMHKNGVNLGADPNEWLPVVKGKVDILLDFDYPNNFEFVVQALSESARLVCKKPNVGSATGFAADSCWWSGVDDMYDYTTLSAVKNANLFDFQRMRQTDVQELEEDLKYLFHLLSTRKIRPLIDRYISFADLPFVREDDEEAFDDIHHNVCIGRHDHAAGCAPFGDVICEPWRM